MPSKRNRIDPQNDLTTILLETRPGVKINVKYLVPSGADSHSFTASKAIYFIHGVAGSSDVWMAQTKYFSEHGYHVIALDLLGHGFSGAPNKSSLYTFEGFCTDCLAVFDMMCKDSNTVVGHSYGTSFAAYLARMRSTKVDRLVLMSGGAPVNLSPDSGVLSLPLSLLICIRPVLKKVFYRNAFHEKSKDLQNKEKAFDVPLYVLRHTMRGQVWAEGDERFHQHITQPTLLLHGESDKLEDVDNTLLMHKVLRSSEFYTIENASHMIMMEQPILVNKLLERFLCANTEGVRQGSFSSINSPQHSGRGHGSKPTLHDHSHTTKSQPNLRLATLTG